MVKKFVVVCLCVMAVVAVFGLQDNMTYDGFQSAADALDGSTSVLLKDVSSISLFAWTVEDFFSGCDIDISFVERLGSDGQPNGHYQILYRSTEVIPENQLPEGFPEGVEGVRDVRDEFLDLSTVENPISLAEAYSSYDRIMYAIDPLISISRVEYNGAFAAVLEVLQYIAFSLTLIWSVLSIVLLVLFDVVGMAWSLIKSGLYLIGLSTI